MLALLVQDERVQEGVGDHQTTVAIAKILGGVYYLTTKEDAPKRLGSLSPDNVDPYRLASELFQAIGTAISRVILVGTKASQLTGWDDFTEENLAEALTRSWIDAQVTACSEATALRAYADNGQRCAYFILDQATMHAKWQTFVSATCFSARDADRLPIKDTPNLRNESIGLLTAVTIGKLLKQSPDIERVVVWCKQGFNQSQKYAFLTALGDALVPIAPREISVCFYADTLPILAGAIQLQ